MSSSRSGDDLSALHEVREGAWRDDQAIRQISTDRLRPLLDFHLRPINQVVSLASNRET
jgi:hypothetical protein